MKNVNYTSSQLLSCARCNGDAIICVDHALTAAGQPYMTVTVASTTNVTDNCGRTRYMYGLSYDEAQLADPSYSLVSTDILGIFCKGCLTTYIDAVGTPSLQYILNLLAPYFDNTCLVTTEAEFVSALSNSDCCHIQVVAPFALTANRTLPIGKVLTIANCCPITTAGHTLYIRGTFISGNYQCFVSTARRVLFDVNSVEQVLPQWFGAVADGATDDSAAIQNAIDSVRYALYSGRYTATAKIFFAAGTYLVETGLDFTSITGVVVEGVGMGSVIHLQTTGTPGIDLTNSVRCWFKDLYITAANDAAAPNVMVLMARPASTASSGWHRFENVQIEGCDDGTTLKAVVYSYGSEINEYLSCRLYVSNPKGVALYLTSKNDLAVVSYYETIAAGEQSATVTLIKGGHIVDNSDQVGANSAIPLYLHNTRDVTLATGWMSTSGNSHIFIVSDGPGQLVDVFNIIGVRFEYGSARNPYLIYIDGAGSVTFGALVGNMFTAKDAVIYQYEAATHNAAVQFGLIEGNSYAGASAPTYLIDLDGGMLSGNIDAQRFLIRAYNIYGTHVHNIIHATDVIASSGNPPINSVILTDGITDQVYRSTGGITLGYGGATTHITRHLSNAEAWNPNIGDGASGNVVIACSGAALGDTVAVGFNVAGGVPAGVVISGSVTNANQVTVTAFNKSGGGWAPGAGTLRVDVWQH